MSLSCDQLLSHEAFQLYITKLSSCSTIWESLSETLLMLLYYNVCSSPTIEALWMCRIDEVKDSPVEWNNVSEINCLKLLLKNFHSVFEELQYFWSCSIPAVKKMLLVCIETSCVVLLCVVLMLVASSNQGVVDSEGMMMMKDAHFVRLLSVILESGIADTSIVLSSRTSISKIIHPI